MYFENQLAAGSSAPPNESLLSQLPKVPVEANALLSRTPTSEEIRQVVFAMNPHKSPGPDGFTAGFFQRCLETIGKGIVECIQQFFYSGRMPPKLNPTFLTLIPKREDCVVPEHYRPIALCNTLYKVITKLLASRLRLYLRDLISRTQCAFVPERQIIDNIVLLKRYSTP